MTDRARFAWLFEHVPVTRLSYLLLWLLTLWCFGIDVLRLSADQAPGVVEWVSSHVHVSRP